ncbi:MAG: DUF1800 domain-containing protein [Chthonomonadales bacterium]
MNRRYLHLALVACLVGSASVPLALAQSADKMAAKPATKAKPDTRPITEDQKIQHVLNRLGFGARPGDVQRVKKMGLKAYIEEQLNPEKIDDSKVDAKVADFGALKLDGTAIAEMERNVQMSNQGLQKLQKALAERGAMAGSDAIQGAIGQAQAGTPPKLGEQIRRAGDIMRNATPEERKMLEDGRMAREQVNQAGAQMVMNKIVRAAESERQLNEVLVDFWSNHFNIDATKVRTSKVVDEQQVIRPHVFGKFRDLLKASANSAAMMIYLDNSQSTATPTAPNRPNFAARPGMAQGNLDQLKDAATRGLPQAIQALNRIQERAKQSGMTEEEVFKQYQGQLARPPALRAMRGGLNENYARELMELHTLGVDGGYTQKDVTEVARCLTGWGVKGGRYSGEFEFHARLHDQTEKLVLGKVIPANGGIQDGETVLDMLASHPSTMKFISTKLCRRFVSDDPPKELIDKCVDTWKKTDGDIREIMRTIVNSKEFYTRSAYMSKIKSPFEYVVSSVRATGASVLAMPPPPRNGPALATFRPVGGGINVFTQNGSGQSNPRLLAGQIGLLGQPLYNYGFPTGYPEESTKWVSSGALIGRINFAINLVNGRINDVDLTESAIDTASIEGKTLPQQIDMMASKLLGTEITKSTRETLLKQLQSGSEPGSMTAGGAKNIASLLLGSPEFQRR